MLVCLSRPVPLSLCPLTSFSLSYFYFKCEIPELVALKEEEVEESEFFSTKSVLNGSGREVHQRTSEREDDGEEMFGDVDDVEERGRPLERLGESGKDAGVLLEVEE